MIILIMWILYGEIYWNFIYEFNEKFIWEFNMRIPIVNLI